MTTRLRAAVRSTRTKIAGWAWSATAIDDETGECSAVKGGYEPTMREALASSHTALGQIHRDLMREVYTDRATRRAPKPGYVCPQCGDEMPPGYDEDDHLNCNYPDRFAARRADR